MGGFGSGRKLGDSCKADLRSHLSLDVRRMSKAGHLVPGRSIDWGWRLPDGSTASIRVTMSGKGVVLGYKVPGLSLDACEVKRYSVPLTWTKCHLGGVRPWFHCPATGCARRVAILYLSNGLFLCRQCQNLCYRSQKENLADRLALQVNKIRRRLGWQEGVLDTPVRDKPKGMHWKTFRSIVDKHDKLQERCLRAILVQIGSREHEF